MRDSQQKAAAKAFAEYWSDKGYEKGESQPFWLSLLRDVYGVEHPEQYIHFEEQVRLDHTSFIDGFIPTTHVLIEQKGSKKDLRAPIKQSDGSLLSPFQQAKRYSAELPYSQRPRWIITCNFEEFLIYDMEKPTGEPESIKLKDLPKEYYRLQFLVDAQDENIQREMEISIKAGELVGMLYDEILGQYIDKTNEHSLKSLNMLCVRLVFCLYAEDSGLFGGHNKFHNYIKSFPADKMRGAIIELFRVLDTKPEDRDPYMDAQLADFPYVNGGLFADENIEIPHFNDKIRSLLLRDASEEFDWSDISPTIFGAVFESTLNPETRRSGGMHYTSIENIHKVIDPLFLDELREELEDIKAIKVQKTREARANAFRDKLASLTFLDPACGSGNFLTETYISLRRLENEAILVITQGQMMIDIGDVIKVSIGQFYGIEINDFAVTVAKTALWIAESQMMQETEDIVNQQLEFLPLRSYANIVEGNALCIDWEQVVPKAKLNYIMGNPPFVGNVQLNKEQKDEMDVLFKKKQGRLDYVSSWYCKAASLIQNTDIQCAFVSTNSITQGIQVPTLWGFIEKHFPIKINFAYRTFRWDSEASLKAHVHVVIIGFGFKDKAPKILFDAEQKKKVDNISFYLTDSECFIVESRTKPLADVPTMMRGNQPSDGGWLVLSDEERNELLKKEPQSQKYIKRFMMGREFLHNEKRYCLWLEGASPAEIKTLPMIYERVKKCRESRLNAPAALTRSFAETPALFGQRTKKFDGNYIALGRVTSENRRYIPMDFLTQDTIAGDKLYTIPGGTIYMFGVLMSNVHMAWMRMFAGRMKSDYSYSTNMVYNTFPWPNPTPEQKATIEKTAQAILDARALYPDCSLADLYDELTMPVELRKAHQNNDRAVMKAYGFSVKDMTESSCVAELMKMYQELTK